MLWSNSCVFKAVTLPCIVLGWGMWLIDVCKTHALWIMRVCWYFTQKYTHTQNKINLWLISPYFFFSAYRGRSQWVRIRKESGTKLLFRGDVLWWRWTTYLVQCRCKSWCRDRPRDVSRYWHWCRSAYAFVPSNHQEFQEAILLRFSYFLQLQKFKGNMVRIQISSSCSAATHHAGIIGRSSFDLYTVVAREHEWVCSKRGFFCR